MRPARRSRRPDDGDDGEEDEPATADERRFS